MDSFWFLIKEFKSVVVSVVPLLVILVVLKWVVFRTPLESNKQFLFGSIFAIIGLFMFLQGAQMSMIPAATDVGRELAQFSRPAMLLIAFVIGFVATLVEPALASVTKEAEIISVGTLTQKYLMILTAIGFAVGMVLGVGKIVYNVNFLHILVPALAVLIILAYFCDQTFAAIAFDCAGATTGPVNIPINMAIALGLANSIKGVDPLTAGFGIIGMTIVGVSGMIMLAGILKSI